MGVLGPLTTERTKYDSDDQSSMVSEPGSEPALSSVSEQDVAMLSSDDGDDDDDDDNEEPPTSRGRPILCRSNAEKQAVAQINRAPTPVMSPNTSNSNLPGHIRGRHPQEHASSDRVEVPSPIDEDEVPTPPSAAEAAGSQLQMLSVNDVEMTTDDEIPTISVQTERSMQLDGTERGGFDQIGGTPDLTIIRKTRARSGALSAGEGSPMRESPIAGPDGFSTKRGFSMGYRADCEKCQQKVPGHMNHLY